MRNRLELKALMDFGWVSMISKNAKQMEDEVDGFQRDESSMEKVSKKGNQSEANKRNKKLSPNP